MSEYLVQWKIGNVIVVNKRIQEKELSATDGVEVTEKSKTSVWAILNCSCGAHLVFYGSPLNKISYLLGLPTKKSLDQIIYYERYAVILKRY